MVFIVFLLAFILRFFRLGEVPTSLYWDEASLGYNAYAIATTLHDEHGELLPYQRFVAFGDYKPPGYVYAAAGAIKIFGLSEFAIRFPSALAGFLLVVVTYFLVKELFKDKRIALFSSAILAISPWGLQMSRAAFEANLATFFSGTGILFFIVGVNRKRLLPMILSSLFLILSMYTFNSHRVFIPLIIVALTLIYYKQLLHQKRNLVLFFVTCFLFVVPLFPYFMTRESRLRFAETSWITDLGPIETSNERIRLDGNSWWAKMVHNRRIVYTQEFLKHYSDNFKMNFLFYNGDANDRLSTQKVGMLYWVELPLLLTGLYQLFKRRDKTTLVILSWLLLAPIPAALARETPHALRFLNVLPVFQIIIAMGINRLLEIKNLKYVIVSGYILFFSFYILDYYRFYPIRSSAGWQYGYKQMVEQVSKLEGQYPCVSVTEDAGRPYIYFLLYNKYPPLKYLNERDASRDWFGLWTVRSFGKYFFGSNPDSKHCLKVNYVDHKFIISGV